MISGMLRPDTPQATAGDQIAAATAAGASARTAGSRFRSWADRGLFPLITILGLLGIGMGATISWGPAIMHHTEWAVPHDLWGTLVAAQRLARLNLAGLYTQPTGLITFPGAALILAPLAAISDAAGLTLQVPGPGLPHPSEWLLAGPYIVLLSSVAIFAADALARRLAISLPKRALLAVTSSVVLWNVSIQWGHPEDAVAVGLFLYGALALAGPGAGPAGAPATAGPPRPAVAAWLIGAGIAVQPLVLLPLPFVLMLLPPRRLPGFLARAAAPAALLLGSAAAANFSATISAVTSQPNWPTVDHPSPWLFLAPSSGGGAVAAGPARLLAIAVACACALIAGRRWRAERQAVRRLSDRRLTELLWWIAVAFALRCVFESVMVAFYLWPALAVALIPAARGWVRELGAFVPAALLTFVSQASFGGTWRWWLPMMAGLILTLGFARPAASSRPRLTHRAGGLPAGR